MIITETHKNYALMVLTAMIFILLILLLKKDNEAIPPDSAMGMVANISIKNDQLTFTEDFKKILKSAEVTGLTVGFKDGQISLLSIDGQFVNPCISYAEASKSQAAHIIKESSSTCSLNSGLVETHAIIAKRSGTMAGSGLDCDLCTGSDRIRHDCSITRNKYRCADVNGRYCSSACGG